MYSVLIVSTTQKSFKFAILRFIHFFALCPAFFDVDKMLVYALGSVLPSFSEGSVRDEVGVAGMDLEVEVGTPSPV